MEPSIILDRAQSARQRAPQQQLGDASSSGALGRALFQQQLGVASSSGALDGTLLSSSAEWRSLERSSAAADKNLRVRSVRKSAPEKPYVGSPKGFP